MIQTLQLNLPFFKEKKYFLKFIYIKYLNLIDNDWLKFNF